MKLIGMLDSPYVRRVAISLQLLGLRFEHQSLSVFRGFDEFRRINPVVKAPTLVCDDGEVLMDSTLILDYAQTLARPRSLLPADPVALQHCLRVVGLALAACEKAVQIVYERKLRPPEKLHEPWLGRVTSQLLAAFDAIEEELGRRPLALGRTGIDQAGIDRAGIDQADIDRAGIDQAGITTAVAWQFARQMVPDALPAGRYPRLAALSADAEALPEFRAAPHGDLTYRAA